MRRLAPALAALAVAGCAGREAVDRSTAERPGRVVLATTDLLDGRSLALSTADRGRCLTISGLDEHDRQCLVAPSARRPVFRGSLRAGPLAQRGPRAPLEVFGEASAAVDAVEVRYSFRGRRWRAWADLLDAADRRSLDRAGIARPFAVFVAELPPEARRVVAVARDRRSHRIGRDDYRDFRDLDRSVAIAGPAKPLPIIPVRRTVGRFEKVRVPVRIEREIGLRGGARRSYLVSTDSPQPQTGCVTLRSGFIMRGRVGTTRRVVLDEADGEGGGLGWCPGPYLGTVVYSPARLVARFSYRVRGG